MRRFLRAAPLLLLLVPAIPVRAAAVPVPPPSIHVAVSFNGFSVPRCLVDSGATASLLDAETAARVPDLVQSGVTLDVALGASRQQATWAWVEHLKTADLPETRAWIVVAPLPEPLCLLGGDVLARSSPVVLDFARQRVTAVADCATGTGRGV